MHRRALACFLFAVAPALACKCPGAVIPCAEAATSDLVFIGTVESVAPKFLDNWNPSQLDSLHTLNRLADAARENQTNSNLTELRDTYLKIFPDLPEESRNKLAAAKTHEELVRSFYFIVNQGRLVHLKVKTKYREGGGDDDAPKDAKPATQPAPKDEDEDPGYIDVWTPFDDCGVDFQVGETYVVYADNDEESRVISTSHCTRTRRISEAGDDLAYLFFLKEDEKKSGELEAYLTTNQFYQKQLSGLMEPYQVTGAMTDAVVELAQGKTVRYALPDANGRLVFDGLSEGAYQLTVYAAGYPRKVEVVAGPKRGVLREKGCAREVFLLPKTPAK